MIGLWKSKLKDKTVLITGASSGIGEAIAREAAALGARLALGARRTDRLSEIAKELSAITPTFVGALDVRSAESTEAFVAEALAKFGSIDMVIANAGFGVVGVFEKLKLDDYKRQFDTNVWGVIETVHATLPALKKSCGRLVLIGSVNSYVSFSGTSPYSMSKYAVRALAESLYHELRGEGVSTTLICPGLVVSEIRQVDNQGIFHPEEPGRIPSWIIMKADVAARKILKAAVCRRREVVITFHGKVGVWLKRHCPNLFHWIMNIIGVRAGKHRAPKAQPPS